MLLMPPTLSGQGIRGTRDGLPGPLVQQTQQDLFDVPIERIAHHATDDAGRRQDEAVQVGHYIGPRVHRDDQRVVILVFLDLVEECLAYCRIGARIALSEQVVQCRIAKVVVIGTTLGSWHLGQPSRGSYRCKDPGRSQLYSRPYRTCRWPYWRQRHNCRRMCRRAYGWV